MLIETCYLIGSMLSTSRILFHSPYMATPWIVHCYPHFTAEETETRKVSLTCSQAPRWEEVKPGFEVGHTDLGSHTLDHRVKILCLTLLWWPHFFRSQHWTAGRQPHQNNRKQFESHQNHPAACRHFLCHPLSRNIPTMISLMTDNRTTAVLRRGLDFSAWPLTPGLLGPVHSLRAPEPVFTFEVTTRMIEPEMFTLMPLKSQKTMWKLFSCHDYGRRGCHQAFSEVIIVSQNRREKFPSTSSKFIGKKASGFEDSLEDKWLCFIYPLLGLFQILLTRFPLTLGRWSEKGNRQNIVDKSSYLFEDKKTSIQRVGARVDGQKETFPPITCSYTSAPGAHSL